MFSKHEAKSRPCLNIVDSFAAAEKARAEKMPSPQLNHPLAVVFITISVLVMSYATLFKVWPILLFFGLWFGTVAFKGLSLMRPDRPMMIGLAIPILCVLSTLWSDYPAKTLYLGTAFIGLVLCIVIICRCVRFISLIDGLMVGLTLALFLTLMNGSYGTDPMTYINALVGLFGSKNMVGFTAEIAIIVGVVICCMKGSILRKLCWGVIPILFCTYCLYLSRSGTAILSLIVALGVMGGAVFVAVVPKALRGIVLGISILLLVAGIGAAIAFDVQEFVLKSLGKDTTLTGRTYLWQEGWKSGHENPILGHGYSAFWVHGQPLAERYWHEFYIAARTGFHFHSTFIQTYVDLGVIGLILISLLILTNCIASLRCLLRYGPQAEPLLLFGLSVMFFVRAWVEIDFFAGPFGMGAFLFYAILPRIALFMQQNDGAPIADHSSHSGNHAVKGRASPSSQR